MKKRISAFVLALVILQIFFIASASAGASGSMNNTSTSAGEFSGIYSPDRFRNYSIPYDLQAILHVQHSTAWICST